MSGLGKTHLNAIHNALRERSGVVNFTAAWQEIHRLFNLGRVERRKLRLSSEELELLRMEAKRAFGWDPIEPLGGQTRLDAAHQAIDEKLATERPDDGFVLVKGALPAPLPALAPGLSLRIPLSHLDLAAIEQVLVIENLDCFDAWEHYPVPIELEGCLVLYRGHGGWARGTRELLASLPNEVRVTAFPDYDPAGLSIAASLPRADALLLPELDQRLLEKGSHAHFARQSRQAAHLEALALDGWQGVWEEIKRHGVSIKQQHMLALGARLRLVPRHDA